MVGIYMFYLNLSNIVQTLIFSATTGVEYPRVVQAYLHARMRRFRVLFRRMIRNVLLACLLALPLSSMGLAAALLLVGKADYRGYYGVFAVLVASSLVAALAQLPYYFLYARDRGHHILACNMVGFVTAVASLPFLVGHLGIIGAAWGALAGNLALFLAQLAVAYRDRYVVRA
jgi:O-antigen/teichoic acid export membrane protein